MEEFRADMTKLIDIARDITPQVICVCITKVDETKTTPVAWDSTSSYTNAGIKKYNEATQGLCKTRNIPFIDVSSILTTDDLYDGLHPNSIGHQKIFDAVKDTILGG